MSMSSLSSVDLPEGGRIIIKNRGKVMKKVLVAYVSRTGKTEKMAEYITEGIRISGNEAELKKIAQS